MPSKNVIAAALASIWLVGCTTEAQQQEKTAELIQARLDAEKVKDLSAANLDLKATNDALKKDNEDLKVQVAKLQGAATAARVASQRVARAVGGKLSPADVDQVRHAVTGGESFK